MNHNLERSACKAFVDFASNRLRAYYGSEYRESLWSLSYVINTLETVAPSSQVRAYTMTQFLTMHNIHRIKLLKIDAEGYDVYMLDELYNHMVNKSHPIVHVDRIFFETNDPEQQEFTDALLKKLIGIDSLLGIEASAESIRSCTTPISTTMDENSKIKLEKITVAGNDRTALSFFDSELQEIKAKGLTLGEMAKLMSAKTERLLSLDMFEAVDTNLVLSTDIHGAPVGELKLNVKEKGVTYFKAETFVKSETTSEVGFELQAALRNPIGYGETFRVNSTTTQTGAREYLSTLSVPNVGPKKLNLNLSLKSSTENMSYYTAYHLKTDALNVELSTQDRKHHLVGEYALRDEIPM
eukprot:gene23841-26977_t